MGAFTLMALGLSLPYLLLSIFPKLVERLPRPGPWMESFKQGMSFLLFGTAAFLLWVYSYQVFDQNAGQKGLWVMLGLALVAAGFWVYGRWDLPSRPSRTRWIGRAVALLLVGAGVGAGWPEKPAQPSQAAAAKIDWQDWSLEKQKALIAADTPVYVDFTARWCLTCQTNKAATYTAAMAEFFQQHGIVALRADKTTTRPDIDRELRRLGKSAIPVNVFYPAGSSTPQVTQTVLTESYLRGFLQSYLRRAE
jgi:thiol:disulfide interchange protein DsbD